ncbi:MAG TPA: CoA-binding protein [Firmicutes bacterium]|nr:CoA-binding protein [Bacillota bacterium]
MLVTTAIEKALRLKNAAVVGLSRDPAKAAHSVPRYLQQHGYRIIPVNPFARELLGERAYAKVSEIGERVDLVIVFRPSSEVPPVVEDALTRQDVQAIWLQEGITNEEAQNLTEGRGLIYVEDKCAFKEHRRLKREHKL